VFALAGGFLMAKGVVGWRRLTLGAPARKAASSRPEGEPGACEAAVKQIGHGVEMNGVLVIEQSLRIEGEFRGTLQSANGIFVAETGTVEAPIRARTVEIHGAVVGNVVASREIVIHETGRLHGDVEAPSIVIARGATFNGSVRMYRPERSLQASVLPELHTAESPLDPGRRV
jgi:cytoskeletal protein CcmA (bactofilin family)